MVSIHYTNGDQTCESHPSDGPANNIHWRSRIEELADKSKPEQDCKRRNICLAKGNSGNTIGDEEILQE